jgi:hypothetical protein
MTSDGSSKPPRWGWIALGLFVLAVLAVPTGIVYLQHRLQAPPRDTIRPWDDPQVAKKFLDARLVKAKAIRAEWRPWALKHKKELKAMLDSQGQNFSALQAVYKISPPLRTGDWRPDTKTGPVKFNWFVSIEKRQANGETFRWADAKSEAIAASRKGGDEKRLREEFVDQSDFTVAASNNAGKQTLIWVSGRVTERSYVETSKRQPGKPILYKTVEEELIPPFDFLTSASSD